MKKQIRMGVWSPHLTYHSTFEVAFSLHSLVVCLLDINYFIDFNELNFVLGPPFPPSSSAKGSWKTRLVTGNISQRVEDFIVVPIGLTRGHGLQHAGSKLFY